MHEFFPKHKGMSRAKIKEDKETGDGDKQKLVKMKRRKAVTT